MQSYLCAETYAFNQSFKCIHPIRFSNLQSKQVQSDDIATLQYRETERERIAINMFIETYNHSLEV